MSTSELNINIRQLEKSILYLFFGVALLFVFLDAFLNYGGLISSRSLRKIFNITREDGVATWFSVLQFTLIGLVCFLIGIKRRLAGAGKWIFLMWWFASAFFIFLSIDDASAIHEKIGTAVKQYSKNDAGEFARYVSFYLSIFPSYTWQLIVAPVFISIGIVVFIFFQKEFEETRSRIYLIVAFLLYGLAISLDFVEGIDGGHTAIENALNLTNYTVRHFSKSLEEFIEMCGSTLILLSLLPLLPSFKINFS